MQVIIPIQKAHLNNQCGAETAETRHRVLIPYADAAAEAVNSLFGESGKQTAGRITRERCPDE